MAYSKIDNKYLGKKILAKDSCGKETIGVIYNGATMIPLCKDCISKIKIETDNLIEGED